MQASFVLTSKYFFFLYECAVLKNLILAWLNQAILNSEVKGFVVKLTVMEPSVEKCQNWQCNMYAYLISW
jgi:hypothetical protein